jgi:hypothetical protein
MTVEPSALPGTTRAMGAAAIPSDSATGAPLRYTSPSRIAD